MTELINDKAVYRTAPATPGLLNSLKFELLKRDVENTILNR